MTRSLSLSLSLTHTHTHSLTLTHTHAHTHTGFKHKPEDIAHASKKAKTEVGPFFLIQKN